MPPEQANGEIDKIGPWSDLYSLGVLLFELLTNQLPFQGSVLSILSQIATKEPPLPSSLRPGLDPRLDLICRRMMAKHPQDRFASMIEVEEVLTSWLAAKLTRSASEGAMTPADSMASLARRVSVSAEQSEQKAAASESLSLAPASGERAGVRGPTPAAKKSIAAPNDIAQQQERAKQFLAKRDYEAAIPLLTKLAALKEPQFQEIATWAKQTLPTAQEQQQKLREAAVSACQKARALRRQCDYAGAVQVLELIPVAGRTTELQQLLAESTDLADECSSLRQDIDESVKRKKYSRLRSLLERYLKLKPDSPKMERLLRNLNKNRPARAVANYDGTQTYFDVAGRLVEPKELILSVTLIVALFIPVYYFAHTYFTHPHGEQNNAILPDSSNNNANAIPAKQPDPSPVVSQPQQGVNSPNMSAPPPIANSPAATPPAITQVSKPIRLTVQPLPEVSINPGEGKRVTVRVESENADGGIRLELQGLPVGVSLKGGVAIIPRGAKQADVELVVDRNVKKMSADVSVVASVGSVSNKQSLRLNITSIVFQDDFKDPNKSKLPSQSQGNLSQGYENGRYFIRLQSGKTSSGGVTFAPPVNDFDAVFTVRASGAGLSSVAIIFREEPRSNNTLMRHLWFVDNRGISVVSEQTFDASGQRKERFIVKHTDIALPRTEWLQLRIRAIGGRADLYVNNQLFRTVPVGVQKASPLTITLTKYDESTRSTLELSDVKIEQINE